MDAFVYVSAFEMNAHIIWISNIVIYKAEYLINVASYIAMIDCEDGVAKIEQIQWRKGKLFLKVKLHA